MNGKGGMEGKREEMIEICALAKRLKLDHSLFFFLSSLLHQTLQAKNSFGSAVEGWGLPWLSVALLGRAGMTGLNDQDLGLLGSHCREVLQHL